MNCQVFKLDAAFKAGELDMNHVLYFKGIVFLLLQNMRQSGLNF